MMPPRFKIGLDRKALCIITLLFASLDFSAFAQNTTISIDLSRQGNRIPDDFVGLSIEVNIARPMFFGTPTQPNRIFYRLLRNLGAGTLRMGGLSQDQYCWDQSAAPNPVGCNGPLLPADTESFYYGAAQSGWPLLLGVNLGQNSGTWAMREIDEGIQTYSTPDQRLGVEIGNEPDGFFSDQLPNGNTMRPATYQLTDYFNDFQGYLAAFAQDTFASGMPVAGPAFDGRWHQPELQQFLDQFAGKIALSTMHWYPTVKCRGPVSISDLLSPSILSQYQQIVGGWQQTAKNHGLGLQLTETNSVACSGMPGVSDAFASAIWGLDWILYSAQLGLRRINFHTGSTGGQNSFYNAIASGPPTSTGGAFTNEARPLYYALHMFASAGPGNILIPLNLQTTANVTAYATTRCSTCPVHVFVVNKDLSATVPVTLSFAQPMQSASLLLLSAGSLAAELPDISYGGAAFDGTTGLLDAPRITTSVAADANGAYSFELNNASAALLTVIRTGANAPLPAASGVVSAVMGRSAVAPGSLASIYGSNLTGTTEQAASNRLPTRIADEQLTVNGIAAPQIYASPGQINFQVPFDAAPGQGTLVYSSGALTSNPVPVTVVPFAPEIFTIPAVSPNQGAVLIAGTGILAATTGTVANARPAIAGEYLSIFCTGLGATTPAVATGVPVSSGSLPITQERPVVTLDGVPVETAYSGLAPQYPGLYQVNVQIPAGTATGDAVALQLTIGGVPSNSVTVAIN
jgi:uncharacterized protein (TIGR03437 family)